MNLQPPLDAENLVELRQFRAEPLFDPWAEVVVPDFPISTLPAPVARYVCSKAEVIGCDPAGLAMSALAALSAAIDHRFSLKIMRHGDWRVSPRLWVLLSGAPSSKKTPTINAATRELEEAQGEAFEAWERAVAEHNGAGGSEEDEPSRPPRYVAGDCTPESLTKILGRSARGVLVKRDELAGWLGGMEKYSSRGGAAADRGFWLEAYNGGRFTVDRVGSGERLIANMSVSMIGGIQPDRLAQMKDQTADGLLQRFLPIILRPANFPIDAPTGDIDAVWYRLIRRLIALEPTRIAFDDEASPEFTAFRQHVHDVERASAGMATGFQGFVGKLEGVAGSLCLILHLAADTVHAPTMSVGIETVLAVRRSVEEFLLPHAFEFYRGAETTTDGDRIQRIASWIVTSRKDRIRTTDLASNVAICRGSGPNAIADMISPLVAAGWLTPDPKDPITKAWVVEPAVQKQFADRRRIEERRKDALASLMKSPRRKSDPKPQEAEDGVE